MLLEGGSIELAKNYRPNWISHSRAPLPVEWIPPHSVSNATVWLISEESMYVTGAMIPVDSGWAAA
jgi:NAD(P)-dependent dehydrogenase (short-subunit alcohol dehydrogenase family)